MGDDGVIKVENVSKKYCKSLKKSMLYGVTDIGRNMFGLRSHSERLRHDEFWAVSDVSFELKRGDTLGLIGPNGSGKTTLLKMLNGIFWPDKGKITIKGRVGALIAVGAGFHPLLTGRENIYINGAILGMSKREIEKKFGAIVDFADIGDFLDTPVKYYSSGMFVRLGFAVAVHSDPDILLVDEILAVGDRDFQIKCYRKMHEIRKTGTTIILVSHSDYMIREYTERCVYINHGKLHFWGSSDECLTLYIKDVLKRKSQILPQQSGVTSSCSKKAQICRLQFFDRDWDEIDFIVSGREINIVLECEMKKQLNNPIFGVNFYDNKGFMYCANSFYENVSFENIPVKRIKVKINIPEFHLPSNKYFCSAVIAEENAMNLIDWNDKVFSLIVGRAPNARGSIKLTTKWEIEPIEDLKHFKVRQ